MLPASKGTGLNRRNTDLKKERERERGEEEKETIKKAYHANVVYNVFDNTNKH